MLLSRCDLSDGGDVLAGVQVTWLMEGTVKG